MILVHGARRLLRRRDAAVRRHAPSRPCCAQSCPSSRRCACKACVGQPWSWRCWRPWPGWDWRRGRWPIAWTGKSLAQTATDTMFGQVFLLRLASLLGLALLMGLRRGRKLAMALAALALALPAATSHAAAGQSRRFHRHRCDHGRRASAGLRLLDRRAGGAGRCCFGARSPTSCWPCRCSRTGRWWRCCCW